MARQLEEDKWILYKHTNNYDMIKAIALVVKNNIGTKINEEDRWKMQDLLTEKGFYRGRVPKRINLDSMGHRINTLEYFMFGYETKINGNKRFIFSPLGNLFLKYIDDNDKLKKIFTTMLVGMQFQHPANGTPASIQLYPFRLIFSLLLEPKLNYKLSFAEYAYFIAGLKDITPLKYNRLIKDIISFRNLSNKEIEDLMKENEHYYVLCVYEWQYYITSILEQAGIFNRVEGKEICRLYHPQKPTSKSHPTGRKLNDGFVFLEPDMESFISKLLVEYSVFEKPIRLDATDRMQIDIIKEIYSFYPDILLKEIKEKSSIQSELLKLSQLIEQYSNNENGETAYLFEDVLTDGFNLFADVEAKKIGGAGKTDLECLYLRRNKKFAVDAKSTKGKLTNINSGRLRAHRKKIGAEYTIVVTPRYVPAVKEDIQDQNVVILLSNTFSEYLYNHINHNQREILYQDFDDIIINHLGEDISKFVSDRTIEKFSVPSDNNFVCEDLEEYQQAAEPYEIFGYSDFEASSKITESEPILVGCYKSPEHLQWILNQHKYNVRLGNRAGSMDEHKKLFDKTHKLVLYNVEEPTDVRVMEISEPIEINGKQINEMGYPDTRPEEYRYEIFNALSSYDPGTQYLDLVKEIISKPGHIEGTPVFITL